MSNTAPATEGRLARLIIIVLVLVAVLAFKPVKVAYHQSAMRKAWAEALAGGVTNAPSLMEFQKHRNALVLLGYFDQKTFQLTHIRTASPEHRALENDLVDLGRKGMGFFAMLGAPTNAIPQVIVWARADQLPAWEAVIKARNREKTK